MSLTYILRITKLESNPIIADVNNIKIGGNGSNKINKNKKSKSIKKKNQKRLSLKIS